MKHTLYSILLLSLLGCGNSQGPDFENYIGTKGEKSVFTGELDPLFEKQWYLHKTFGINVEPVWSETMGDSVSISVVDSGIEASHPDLQANVDMVRSFRYFDGSSDPSPTREEALNSSIDESHGTAVAGIISASHNDIGIIGIAPNSTLVGLNVFSRPDDSSFEDAIKYSSVDISSNSWGTDLSTGLSDDRVVLEAIIAKMSKNPIIYTFAAGNDATNSGFSSVLNSRYTLVVGASTDHGKIARYSNHGTNILCVAPGGEYKKIVTTDLLGESQGYDVEGKHFDIVENQNYDYTNLFSGTSAAVPMVSGVVALMLDVNPNLSYRDVKYILAHTSKKIDQNHPSWQQNGAGLWVSNYYGYGLIDAQKAVSLARDFQHLSREVSTTVSKSPSLTIADDDSEGISLSFDVNDDFVVEYLSLVIDTRHTHNGDLKIELTSPIGTHSQVTDGDTSLDDDFASWEFGDVSFMDEKSRGQWKLNISDIQKGNTGRLNHVKLKLYGHKK